MSLIQELHKERLSLEKKLRIISGTISALGGKEVKKVKRKLSAEGRRKISQAAKAMWKAKKALKKA
jgi:hypothetical protein